MKKALFLSVLFALLLVPQVSSASTKSTVKNAFGVNMHLRQRITEADWDTVMDSADEAGVQWGREQFDWDVIEPSDGTYSWASYDKVLAEYTQRDIKMLGLLTYSSSWASAVPGSTDSEFYPPDMTAWKDYVATVADHYKDDINYWEIWNEPNHEGFWKGDLDGYSDLIVAASAAIKAANPDAKIVLGGLSGSDADYLDDLYTDINDASVIDVVAFHPYRVLNGGFNNAPEMNADGLNTLLTDIYNMKAVVRKHDKANTPLWITELGWTTYADGVTKTKQAQFLMRAYTTALAIPNVKKVFWYTFSDTSSDNSLSEAKFGLVDVNYKKKKALDAFTFTKNHLNRHYLKDQSLPRQTLVDDFSINTGWALEGTECTKGSIEMTGNGRMQINYNFFGSTNCYAPIKRNVALPNNTRALLLKMKGSDDQTTARVRITDATGETFQYTLGYMPGQWLYYPVQLNRYSDNWNGDGDGKLDRPLKLESIVFDDKDGELEEGTVTLDEIYASPVANTMLYRFHKGGKDLYAYWTAKRRKNNTLNLTGAGKVRVERFKRANVVKSSGTATYKVKSDRLVKFLQTL